MPQFFPGEQKTAKIAMRNPTGRSFDYTGCLYLGIDLTIASEKGFNLAPGEERQVNFPVTMPVSPGIYPTHVGVFAEGENISLYRAVEDVHVVAPAVEITKVYIRPDPPTVSEAYSGWITITPGGQLTLNTWGWGRIQVGALIRNP